MGIVAEIIIAGIVGDKLYIHNESERLYASIDLNDDIKKALLNAVCFQNLPVFSSFEDLEKAKFSV